MIWFVVMWRDMNDCVFDYFHSSSHCPLPGYISIYTKLYKTPGSTGPDEIDEELCNLIKKSRDHHTARVERASDTMARTRKALRFEDGRGMGTQNASE